MMEVSYVFMILIWLTLVLNGILLYKMLCILQKIMAYILVANQVTVPQYPDSETLPRKVKFTDEELKTIKESPFK